MKFRKSTESIWGIRKACVDIIVDIAKICERSVREDQLT